MGGWTQFLEMELLDHVLGAAAYSAPATVHIALYSAAPTDAGGGTELVIGSSPGYARLAVTNNATNWPAATSIPPMNKSNGTAFTFAEATGAWLTAVAWGIFDAATSGNLLAFGTLDTSRTLAAGDRMRFAIGALDLTCTAEAASGGGMSSFLMAKLFDHVFGNTAYTAPADTFVALYSAGPTIAGGGTELTGGSYARTSLTNNATNWPAASQDTGASRKSTGTVLTFPEATGAWSTATHWGIFATAISTDLLWFGDLSVSRTLATGDRLRFAVGDIDCYLNNV